MVTFAGCRTNKSREGLWSGGLCLITVTRNPRLNRRVLQALLRCTKKQCNEQLDGSRQGCLDCRRSRMLKTLIAIVVAFAASTTAAIAQDLGPAVGTKAPDIGAPLDQGSKPRPIGSLMGDKGLVLFFFRSTVW